MPSSPSRNVELQERDLALLKGLFESRVLTLTQAAAIHFEGGKEAAKKRIQKLKAGGYLAERPRRVYAPSILFLTRKAFTALADGGHLDGYPPLAWTNLEKRARVSDMTLRHELDVLDVKAAFFTAARNRPDVKVAEFLTWPLLYEFEASPGDGVRTMAVRPDGFIRLHQTEADGTISEHLFFLEVDRSTEVLDTLVTRSRCYRDYYRRGGLAVRHGQTPFDYEQFPFRVLVVVRNAERRNNLAERLLLLRPPILSQVWLSTLPETTQNPLGAVWVRPQDHRDATAGTPFAVPSSRAEIYRRSEEREVCVERSVHKHPFLT